MEILKTTYADFNEWKFKVTQTVEQTYEMDIEKNLIKLLEIKSEIDKVPAQIENLNKQKEQMIKFYNEGIDVLAEWLKHFGETMELPEKIV